MVSTDHGSTRVPRCDNFPDEDEGGNPLEGRSSVQVTPTSPGNIDHRVYRYRSHSIESQGSEWEKGPRKVTPFSQDHKPMDCTPRVEGEISRNRSRNGEIDENGKREARDIYSEIYILNF